MKKAPSWKKIVVLKDGVPIRKTRKYWLIMDRLYNLGDVPSGYEVRMKSGEPLPARIDCMGLLEVLDKHTLKRTRKPMASAAMVDTGAAEQATQKLAAEVADLLK